MAETKTKEKPEKASGFLGTVEKIGNKLPDPFWLFVILAIIVAITSWIGHLIGMSAEDPKSGDTIEVESLLTTENISRMVTDAVENFTSFPPLGVILAVMLGVAVAEQSGLLSALVRAMVAKVSPKFLTFIVALAGVTGSVASDAIYVILIPLGAMAFHSVGRSPIVGAMVAFAASSAGFNASLILNITDLLLAGISTPAAQFVDEAYEVSPLANIFFVIPSAIVLSLIITAVTEWFMVKKARDLVNHDKINYEEVSFSQAAGAADNEADEDAEEGDVDFEEEEDELRVKPEEQKGLTASGIALLIFLAGFFALLFIPGSPLASQEDSFMESPLISAIAVPIALAFLVCGIVYGIYAGTLKSASDVPDFMAKGIKTLVPMLVLFFAALVAMVAVLNLFITSGSAQWALMAPVIVPMMMYVGISPEVSQMLFRIGDSPTNIITPMSPYFALALTFLQRYYKPAGVGTLMSLALPYSIAMIVGWFIFFIVWYLLGIPLGPGAPMHYPA